MAPSQIPKTMRAAQIVEFNKPYQINEVSVPSVSDLHPQDLLVRVAVASLCHTDGMVASGAFGSDLPQTGSHEGAGKVVAVGSEVKGWEVGDRVMCGLQTHRCGQCISCQGPETEQQYCSGAATRAPGIGRDGCFAEYGYYAKESNKLPDSVTFESAAPLACAGRTIYRGIVQSRLKAGQTIGIVGSGGGLGHLGIQFAKAFRLKVIAIDVRDNALELSREADADIVIDGRIGKDEVVKKVMELTDEGCDSTVNVSDADDAAGLACAITKMHARMIQMAQPDNISVPFQEIIFRNIKIEGSLIASAGQGDEMLKVIGEHKIKVKTHNLHGLEKVNELVELSHNGKLQGKGIIILDEEAIKEEKSLGATN